MDKTEELIEKSQRKAKADVYTLLAADAEVNDISCASYDIVLYALHKYPKDEDVRKFRFYIEGKIKQYLDNQEESNGS